MKLEGGPVTASTTSSDTRRRQEKTNTVWKPLTSKMNLPATMLCPYMILMFLRLVVVFLMIAWRLTHPNKDALWLWGMSVICEIWFALSWLLDQLPKLRPVTRNTYPNLLKDKFENFETGESDLPGIDVFVTTSDPKKEPPIVTANTVLSILAADYPADRFSCFVSDDAASFITYQALCEAATFAKTWVPFCRRYNIEPRSPEAYFNLNMDPTRNQDRQEFLSDCKQVKQDYKKFKVKINSLSEAESGWPGTWANQSPRHSTGDHEAIIEVVLNPGNGNHDDNKNWLPMLVYMSRERCPGYPHNKKAGAMNALIRASAIMSNGGFILNLDCDHYIYNSQALREGMCFMMDRGGNIICYVQFPQRFEGIDPFDRYANKNTVFFDVTMKALDGIQGPFYVGTGCLFRRTALYGYEPTHEKIHTANFLSFLSPMSLVTPAEDHYQELKKTDYDDDTDEESAKFGTSSPFIKSIDYAKLQGLPLHINKSQNESREPGELIFFRRKPVKETTNDAKAAISCWYENTEWGQKIGWIYGSITEDVLTGYMMHNRGWESVYCVPKRDAFQGSAPINLTDRLHQVLRWATGSVEILFSDKNGFSASNKMKILQRLAYINLGIYPFTSFFLTIYCLLPAFSVISGHLIVNFQSESYLTYLLIMTVTLCMLATLEVKWSNITLEEYWRNEQFWLLEATSAHLAAVLQGFLKVLGGTEISFTVTSKSAVDDSNSTENDKFEDLDIVKWTPLMIPPILTIAINMIGIAVGFSRYAYSTKPELGKLIGGVFFSFCVLAHLYPFLEGLKGKGRMPTIVYIWAGLIVITISQLCGLDSNPMEFVG